MARVTFHNVPCHFFANFCFIGELIEFGGNKISALAQILVRFFNVGGERRWQDFYKNSSARRQR